MSGPNPIGKFLGCRTPTVDGEPIRTIEYDMTDLVTDCISMYAELIDEIVPGSSKLIKPTDLPTDSSRRWERPGVQIRRSLGAFPRPKGMATYP